MQRRGRSESRLTDAGQVYHRLSLINEWTDRSMRARGRTRGRAMRTGSAAHGAAETETLGGFERRDTAQDE
jgi:hypothetical protein